MKRCLGLFTLMLALCLGVSAQIPQGLNQSWVETITLAPPAINNTQTASNTTGTGVQVLSSGGSIAAGSYRCGVTLYTATNTETPLSTDTAASSVLTTIGSTSSIIIQSPVANGVGANVVGWRPYCGVSGGASGAETLVSINNTVCSLSTSSTPSCAIASPATLTLQSQFAAGSGGPATPGTAIFPALNNAANIALFENSTQTYRRLNWVVSGTAPGTCTIQVQTGSTVAGLANVGQALTCTSSGGYSLPSTATAVYSSLQLSAYTAGDTTTQVTFYYSTLPFNPSGTFYFGNAAPTGTCPTGGVYDNTVGTVSITLYTCNAGTWTAITVP